MLELLEGDAKNPCQLSYAKAPVYEGRGAALNEEILFSLNGYIDIDSHHHGELAALFSLPKEI